MTQITAWLVALTLIGSPLAPAVCASFCGHGVAATAHCHEAMREAAQPAISAESICGFAITDAAFINDRTTLSPVAALPAATPSTLPLAILAGSSRVLTVPVAVAWLAPPSVLRL
jgi:hypothetical protein